MSERIFYHNHNFHAFIDYKACNKILDIIIIEFDQRENAQDKA